MDDLVSRLSSEGHEVETIRPQKSAEGLKRSIDRNYVHITFKKTGTELGVQLDRTNCKFEGCDFEAGIGIAHLEGGLTLNYEKVKLIADINLQSLEGQGYLVPVDDTEYKRIMVNK